MNLPDFIIPALENIYISPLELCNLACKYCYTNKTKNILSNQQILDFTSSYSAFLRSNHCDLKSILFCGGEVFLLPDFTNLINKLTDQHIFVSIITNGTVDKLDQIKNPNNAQLLVSLDGPRDVHDANRGVGNFDKSIEFITHALDLGFHTEIMFLVTRDSYPYIDSFQDYIFNLVRTHCDTPLHLNYITIKSRFYTTNHPLSIDNPNSLSLTPAQTVHVKRNYATIPTKNFGCFQLSLQSNGHLYGCCESPTSLGTLLDPLDTIITNFINSLTPCQNCLISRLKHESREEINFFARSEREPLVSEPEGDRRKSSEANILCESDRENKKISSRNDIECGGCCNPDFLCGYKKELKLIHCADVVDAFNK